MLKCFWLRLLARCTEYSQGVSVAPRMLEGCRSCSEVMMNELLSSAGCLGRRAGRGGGREGLAEQTCTTPAATPVCHRLR